MFRTSIGGQINALGIGIPLNIQIDSDSGEGFQDTVAAGAAGALTTRTDNDTGGVTLEAGHGITTGKRDIFWEGGSRSNVDATVNGNSVAIDGGSGDNLPPADTPVVLATPVSTDRDIVGNDLKALILYSDKRAAVTMVDAEGAVIFRRDLTAGRTKMFVPESAAENPLATLVVADVLVSNGDSAASATITVLAGTSQ